MQYLDVNVSAGKLLAMCRRFTLLRTATGVLALRVCAGALGFLNGILLARLLGPAQFGVYSIGVSTATLGATIAVLGLPMMVTREAAADAEHQEWSRLRGLLRSVHHWVFISSLGFITIAGTLLLTGLIKLTISQSVIVMVMLLVPLAAFNQLRAAILRGWHRVILADIPDMFLRPAGMFLLLLGTVYTATSVNAADALTMQFAAVAVALGVGSWWLVSRRPAALRAAIVQPPAPGRLMDAIPFLIIAVVTLLESQISLYLLGYLGDSRQAGLFQAAIQLVNLIAIGLTAVNMPLQPRLAAAWACGDTVQAQGLLRETARLGAFIAFTGVVVIFLFSDSALHLYGAKYLGAKHALEVVAIGQLVNASAGSCGILLLMTGHQKIVMWGITAATLLNLGVAYWSIPALGVMGGALAATASLFLWNFLFVIYAFKKLGLNTTVFQFQ